MDSLQRELADLRPGDHACLLYDDAGDFWEVLIAYVREGLARGEQCVYVGDESVGEVAMGLRDAGIAVDANVERGTLVLLARAADPAAGRFDAGAMRDFLRVPGATPAAAGVTGVRIVADMTWAISARVPAATLIEYEARANTDVFPAMHASALCLYPRSRFPEAVLRDALHVHPFVVVGQHVSPNLHYRPPRPGQVLAGSPSLEWLLAEITRSHTVEGSLKELLGTAPLPIIGVDLDATVMFWNAAAEQLFGWKEDEVIGAALPIVPDDGKDEAARIHAAAVAGQTLSGIETRRRRRDGALVDVALSVAPLRGRDGVVRGTVGILADISALKIAQRQLEEASRIKDEFLAVLSHELRTPLTSVLGWARMLVTQELDAATTRKALDAIARNAEAQVRLVNDLLDISRIVRGELKLDLRLVDLAAIVAASAETLHVAAGAKQLRVDVTLPSSPAVVAGDSGRLQQVVWNLVSNAVKFTPPNGRVTVEVAVEDSAVRLRVADTGKGIEAEFLPRLFARFTQAEGSSRRHHGGLGIGLAIVHHLVEHHGGTVEARSEGAGKGAAFTVTLPRVSPSP